MAVPTSRTPFWPKYRAVVRERYKAEISILGVLSVFAQFGLWASWTPEYSLTATQIVIWALWAFHVSLRVMFRPLPSK